MPKISTIIPVYNTDPSYIDRALKSVLSQVEKDIEIIIVDDGSKKSSTIQFLKDLETRNISNLKVFFSTHKGAGGARNFGLSKSHSEFISFLDSDDWLDSNFYNTLLSIQQYNDSDMVCATLIRSDAQGRNVKKMDNYENMTSYSLKTTMKYITNGSLCSKLFKKSLFSDLNHNFDEDIYYEDNPVLVDLLIKSKKISFTNKTCYYYFENMESSTRAPRNEEKRVRDSIKALERIKESVNNLPINEKNSILKVFFSILFSRKAYGSDSVYRNELNRLFGSKFIRKNTDRYSFLERIFSIKKHDFQNNKVLTIFGLRINLSKNLPKN